MIWTVRALKLEAADGARHHLYYIFALIKRPNVEIEERSEEGAQVHLITCSSGQVLDRWLGSMPMIM
jgi:hypothetical protein